MHPARTLLAVGAVVAFATLPVWCQTFLPDLDPITPENVGRLRQLVRLEIPNSAALQEMATVAFSPDGRFLAAAGLSTRLPVWNLESGELAWTFRDGYRVWVSVDIHPTEPVLVAGDLSGAVAFFDLETGEKLSSQRTGISDVHCLRFNQDGTQLVSVNLYDSVVVWDVQDDWTLTKVVSSQAHGDRVNFADFNPDGTRIVSGGADDKARVWDASTGDSILVMSGPAYFVEGVEYSPDGTWIAGAADDGRIYLWDAETGDRVATLRGSVGPVNGVTFNHAGTLVAGFSNGLMALVWDISSPYTATRLYGHEDLVLRGAFSPDDRILASISRDRTVILWGVPTDSGS